MGDVIQFRDYRVNRDAKALEREAMAIVNELFAFAGAAEQSHYHNLAEPIYDPRDIPPESA